MQQVDQGSVVPSSRVSKRRRNSFATHLGERAGRRSWTDAEHLALKLTSQLAALQCAASLAGTPMTQQEHLLALVVDADGLHRRRGGEAWATDTGRTARWGALLKLRARLRAADLDGFEPYRRPAPMRRRKPFGSLRIAAKSQRIDVLRMGRGVLMYPTLDPPGGLRRRGGDGQHVEGAVHGFPTCVRVEQPCQLDSRVNPTWVGSGR